MFHEKCHQEVTIGIDTDATKVFSTPVHKAASILKAELEKEPNTCTKFMERLAKYTTPLQPKHFNLVDQYLQSTPLYKPPL